MQERRVTNLDSQYARGVASQLKPYISQPCPHSFMTFCFILVLSTTRSSLCTSVAVIIMAAAGFITRIAVYRPTVSPGYL